MVVLLLNRKISIQQSTYENLSHCTGFRRCYQMSMSKTQTVVSFPILVRILRNDKCGGGEPGVIAGYRAYNTGREYKSGMPSAFVDLFRWLVVEWPNLPEFVRFKRRMQKLQESAECGQREKRYWSLPLWATVVTKSRKTLKFLAHSKEMLSFVLFSTDGAM